MRLFDIRAIALPYCLKLQPCGRYALLNRNYKPLGFIVQDWLDYSSYPVLLNIRVTPSTAKNLSYQGDKNILEIWLYGDGCIPTCSKQNWQAYTVRLAVLSKLKHFDPSNYPNSKIAAILQANLKDAATVRAELSQLKQWLGVAA